MLGIGALIRSNLRRLGLSVGVDILKVISTIGLKRIKKFLCIFSVFALTVPAFADVYDYNITINRIAADNGDKAFIRPLEQLSHACVSNVIFFDLTSASGKAYLTLITSAKMAGKKLAVVTYSVNTSNQCWLTSLEME